MGKKLSWKKKNQLLLAGALLLCWLTWSFAIRNTFALRSHCLVLQAKLDSAAGAPEQLASLRAELHALEAITGNSDSANSLHCHLLDVVTRYCEENQLILRDFASPVRYPANDWIVETHPITVEGGYIPLLKLVHQLEQEKNGKVVSVDFHSKRDNKTEALSLLVTIYVQTIIRVKA
jgi:hypothetical protein